MRQITAVLLLALSVCPVIAEEPDRGRLADGRAYRTDNQGNQLVDYIAELELNVDNLKKRVNGLEDELSQKQRILDRAGIDQATNSLNEKTLVSDEATEKQVSKSKLVQAQPPQPNLWPAEERSDKDQAEISRLNQELNQARTEIAELRQVDSKSKVSDQSQVNDLKNVVHSLEQDLAQKTNEVVLLKSRSSKERQSAEGQIEQAHQNEVAELRNELETLRQELSSAQNENSTLKAKYQDALENQNELKSQLALAATQKTVESKESVTVAKVERAKEPQTAKRDLYEERGKPFYSEAKARAVESVREILSEQLEEVRNLVDKRDRLFSGYKPRSSTVQFKVSRPVSSRNRSLDVIERQAGLAGSVNELTTLRIDLSEIRRKVEDDISLMKRMG